METMEWHGVLDLRELQGYTGGATFGDIGVTGGDMAAGNEESAWNTVAAGDEEAAWGGAVAAEDGESAWGAVAAEDGESAWGAGRLEWGVGIVGTAAEGLARVLTSEQRIPRSTTNVAGQMTVNDHP